MPDYSGELRVHRDARFAIIASRWNPGIVDVLIDGARRTLLADGVDPAAIDVVRVPGAWEIPATAAKDKELTRKWILGELGLHEARETIEAVAEIRKTAREPYACAVG